MTLRSKSKIVVDKVNESEDEITDKLEKDYADLSFKAIGIFYYLKGKRNEWMFDEKDLYDRFKDGKTSVRSGIKELKKHGIIREEPYSVASYRQGKKWVLSL